MTTIEAWLVALAVAFAPPDKHEKIPTWNETVEARVARYGTIATDIAFVVDRAAEPLPGLNRSESAALVLAVAIGESGLQPDVDLGPCYRKGPFWRRCDAGKAVGIMQLQVRYHLRAKLFKDRRALLARAYQGIRGSLLACAKLPTHERLAVYGAGTCTNVGGRAGSRRRWGLFLQLLGAKPVPAWPAPAEAQKP